MISAPQPDPTAPPLPPGIDSAALLRLLLGRIDQGVCLLDPADRVVLWNEAYLRCFPEDEDLLRPGLPFVELLRRFFAINLPAEDLPLIERHIEAGLARHRGQRAPYDIQRKDGRWLRVEACRLGDGGVLKLWTDVTAERLLPADRAAMRNPLLEAIEGMPEGFALFDAADAVVLCNAKYRALMGNACRPGSAYKVILRAAAESGHFAAAAGRSGAWVAELLARHRSPGLPVEEPLAGGHWVRIAERLTAGGDTVCVVSDITEQKRREEELVARAARLEVAVDNMVTRTESVVRTSRDGFVTFARQSLRIASFNPAAEAIFGRRAETVIGRPVTLLFDGAEEEGAPALPLDAARREVAEARGRRSDGTVFDMEVSVTEAGGDAFWAAMFRDITGRKRAERALRDSERRFRELIEGSIQGIVIHRDFKPLFANDAYARIVGFGSAAEVLALPSIKPLIPPEQWPAAEADYAALVRGERQVSRKRVSNRRPDGAELWLDLADRAVDWLGEPAVQVTVVDITSQVLAEAQAAESSAQLKAAFDAMPNGICMFDADLRVVVFNRRYAALWDLPEALLAQRPALPDLVRRSILRGDGGGGDPEAAVAAAITRLRGDGPLDEVHRLVDGRILEVQGNRRPDGGFVYTCLDITDRKRSEAEIARKTAILEATLENMSQGIAMVDAEGRVLATNRRLAELYGIPHALIRDLPHFADLIRYAAERGEYGAVDVDAAVGERLATAFRKDTPVFEHHRPDGTVLEVATAPTPDGGFVRTYTNITGRKRAEEILRQSEARLLAILEASPVGVSITTPEGEILFANRRWVELHGLGRDDLLQRNARSLYADPTVRDRLKDMLHRHGDMPETEVEMRGPGGRPAWWIMSSRVTEFDGRRVHISWFYDITDRKRVEQALQAAKERAEAALRDLGEAQENLVQAERMASLGQLVAGVAHEINTPIGITLTAASHLGEETRALRTQFEEGQLRQSRFREYLDLAIETTRLMVTNIERAAGLIQGFKQVAVDQTSAERRCFNIREYINEALLSLHPRLKKTMHHLVVDCPGDLTIDSYPGALFQVLSNLVMNSLLHGYDEGAAGTITITVTQPTAEDVELRYADDGKGIPARNLPKIFDPFFTTRRGSGGSGLGLHIVYNLVTRTLCGSIAVDSGEGRGAVFTIRFPRIIPGDERTAGAAPAVAAGDGIGSQARQGPSDDADR